MSKVFISYRREDAAGYAQAIYGQLERHLRRDQIFMDVDTIEPGVDFVARIEQAVSDCDVVVALIGKRWLGEQDNAPPRIHQPHDFVHLEIAAALSRDIRVIPVLVDGASMPRTDELPRTLQLLVRRHAMELSNTRFRFDLERISEAVQKALLPPDIPEPARWRWRPWMWFGVVALFLITLGIAAGLWFKEGKDDQTAKPEIEQVPPPQKEQRVEEDQRKRERQIVEFLSLAEQAENAQRLTTPAEDNATLYFREVLQLDPGNPDAQQGLKRIGERYAGWAEQALGQRQFDKAAEYLAKAALVNPDHPALAELRKHLDELLKAQDIERARADAERKKQEELKRLEERAARDRLAPGKVFRDRLKTGGEGPEMVVVPAGTFPMGDVQGIGDIAERPVHKVTIAKPFAIGRYEVTFVDYDRFAKATGRELPPDKGWGRRMRPVIFVNWQDARTYAEWLSAQTGKRYRLPTEAEWEYAARGGTETFFWWGKRLIKDMANCSGCGSRWDEKQTTPVGSFKANGFGLFDTAGNVWEWVEDCMHENYAGAPTNGSAWLEPGGGDCGQRVLRGGSLGYSYDFLRSSSRKLRDAVNRDYFVGFRLAQDFS